jgi:MerR HTH family regulatory protein
MAKWSDKTKRQALEIYQESGSPTASRATGVPQATIRFWARELDIQPPEDYRAQYRKDLEHLVQWTEVEISAMRQELRGRLIHMAGKIVNRMEEPYEEFVGVQARAVTYEIPPSGATRDFAVAAGILIDKFRLESGEASAVIGSVEILPKLDDHEKAALAEVLRNAIRENASGDAVATDAVATASE